MSFDDETQDIVTCTGHHVRLRSYRKDDNQKVRDLFMYCVGNGPGAPRETALVDQLHQPFAQATYAIFTVGLTLGIKPSLPQEIYSITCRVFSSIPTPVRALVSNTGILHILESLGPWQLLSYSVSKQPGWGLMLCLFSAGSFLSYMALVNHAFVGYCKYIVNTDLNDIVSRYQSPEALKKGGQFWVVENVDKDSIIACIGLDASGHETTLDLRRMCVHPAYHRLGLGHHLINALLAHVLKHNARCSPGLRATDIVLSTSSYHPGALTMYEQHGWVSERTEVPVWYIRRFYLIIMRRKIGSNRL